MLHIAAYQNYKQIGRYISSVGLENDVKDKLIQKNHNVLVQTFHRKGYGEIITGKEKYASSSFLVKKILI